MFYVYVLESGVHRYIGRTNSLRKRLSEHNTGKNFLIKSEAQWKLIYYEAHLSFDDAKRRENYFKTSVGRRSLNRMLANYTLRRNSFGTQSSTSGKAARFKARLAKQAKTAGVKPTKSAPKKSTAKTSPTKKSSTKTATKKRAPRKKSS